MKKKILLTLSIILLLISILLIVVYLYCYKIYTDKNITNIEIQEYQKETNELSLKIHFSNNYNNIKCGYYDQENKEYVWNNIKNNSCTVHTNSDNLEYLYLKKNVFENKIELDNLYILTNVPEKLYLTKGEIYNLKVDYESFGKKNNQDIIYKSQNENIVTISEQKLTGNKIGRTTLDIYIGNKKQESIEINVTSLINERTSKINNDKPYLPCEKYSKTETEKLEDILKTKIDNVGGLETRAAVVEAVRFLTFDFKYKIDYFFENGRIEGGVNEADGEGRYYHKGLYLHEDKFKTITSSFAGPAIWGCPLMNYEDYGTKYKRGTYNSNGLDCSGFVTWAILNGGFDVGDKGAGDNLEDENEINDVGDKYELTDEIIKSGKVKAGDLVGSWGHIGIIAGIDKENVYVAESLWTYGGVAVNTYPIEELDEEFTQVVLMDKVYKKDGIYTNMWY